MKNKFSSSPLPFQGQKRNFLKEFKKELVNYPDDAIYVDLFGGSGLLSHTVKQEKPNAKVIYNDYDNFSRRIKSIPVTNEILEKLREILKSEPRKVKIVPEKKREILSLIKNYELKYWIDYITLSSSLLFSANYVKTFSEFKDQTFYNNIRKSSYQADGYLEEVIIDREDYKTLFDRYRNKKNVVFLIDPPYLSTDVSSYKNYWKLSDYLDVLKVLYHQNYFYFTSNKSQVIELCEWIENNTGGVNPFNDAKISYQYNRVSYNGEYTDVMVSKKWTTSHT